jgi:hypothetical protein
MMPPTCAKASEGPPSAGTIPVAVLRRFRLPIDIRLGASMEIPRPRLLRRPSLLAATIAAGMEVAAAVTFLEEPPADIHKPKHVHGWRELLTGIGGAVLFNCYCVCGNLGH